METLYQGDLHPLPDVPKSDMPWLGIEPGPPQWEASTLAKSYSKSLLIAIRIIYIRVRDIAPPSACVT
jgi:hypothetical protein